MEVCKTGNTCSIQTETCGFACTGYDGSHKWKELHAIADSVECDSCRDHAKKMMSGLHDHVTAGIGENDLFNEENYLQFADEVACVRASYCKRTGRC